MKPKGRTAGSRQTGIGRPLETDILRLLKFHCVSFLLLFARPLFSPSPVHNVNVTLPPPVTVPGFCKIN